MLQPDGNADATETLAGKVALISGGASGIGRATAALLARRGAAVAIVDVAGRDGRAAVDAIVAAGSRAIFVDGDVSRDDDCRRAVQRTVDELGGLHILVNNAGIIGRTSVVETTEADWDRCMAINVKGVFLLSKHAIPVMIRSGGGAIVNTSSGWGLVGGRRAAPYCASKGAVVLLTKAMALDHGAENIRVNCICPGDTDTALLRREAEQLGEPADRFLTNAAARPLKRVGSPEDIARGVLYLASDASSWVTGTTLVVDGGGLAG